jgi:hypothetical protein
MSTIKEGWGYLQNVGSNKWHYFKDDGRSLCGRFMNLSSRLEQGNDESPDNCAACRKKRLSMIVKEPTQ